MFTFTIFSENCVILNQLLCLIR